MYFVSEEGMRVKQLLLTCVWFVILAGVSSAEESFSPGTLEKVYKAWSNCGILTGVSFDVFSSGQKTSLSPNQSRDIDGYIERAKWQLEGVAGQLSALRQRRNDVSVGNGLNKEQEIINLNQTIERIEEDRKKVECALRELTE